MSKSVLAVVLALAASAAHAGERLPPLKPEAYDAEQKKAAAEFEAARKTGVFGPFAMLMRSPQVMSAARAMGDELRYKSAVGNTLSEMVVLIVAREWGQDYEWSLHAPIALKQGVSPSVVDAIAEGRRPAVMSEDEAIAYDFSIELNRTRRVSDATYARALKRWGERGVVDLAAISGYYTFLAMTMNTARTAPAPGGPTLPRWPE